MQVKEYSSFKKSYRLRISAHLSLLIDPYSGNKILQAEVAAAVISLLVNRLSFHNKFLPSQLPPPLTTTAGRQLSLMRRSDQTRLEFRVH